MAPPLERSACRLTVAKTPARPDATRRESPCHAIPSRFVLALAGLLLAGMAGARPTTSINGAAGQDRLCQVARRLGRLVRRARLESSKRPRPGPGLPPAIPTSSTCPSSPKHPWRRRFRPAPRRRSWSGTTASVSSSAIRPMSLYKLARKAIHAQRASLAYELALLALAREPRP